MHKMLEQIIKNKEKEVRELKALNLSYQTTSRTNRFSQSLSKPDLSIIAEIKRKSPSKGFLAEIKDPVALAEAYVEGGASAISVLTDEEFFAGNLADLEKIVQLVSQHNIPVLRKDFIIDESQIVESISAGADAILLIVKVLQSKTKDLLLTAKILGIEAMVEVHDQKELEYALSIGAEIIGINNRNLDTFDEDLQNCLSLIEFVPNHVLTVAESAIKSMDDLQLVKQAGFDGVLIGEALVNSDNPKEILSSMKEIA